MLPATVDGAEELPGTDGDSPRFGAGEDAVVFGLKASRVGGSCDRSPKAAQPMATQLWSIDKRRASPVASAWMPQRGWSMGLAVTRLALKAQPGRMGQ